MLFADKHNLLANNNADTQKLCSCFFFFLSNIQTHCSTGFSQKLMTVQLRNYLYQPIIYQNWSDVMVLLIAIRESKFMTMENFNVISLFGCRSSKLLWWTVDIYGYISVHSFSCTNTHLFTCSKPWSNEQNNMHFEHGICLNFHKKVVVPSQHST